MDNDSTIIFETERLLIRTATEQDIGLYLNLWTDPRVMTHVGFPYGLKTDRDKIRMQIQGQGESEFDRLLVVVLKETGESLGECEMSLPNQDGIAKTDVKLLPEFWGNKYGVEIKQGLLIHLFNNTDCIAVEASPNKNNIASIKMQEAVGGKRIGEKVFEFPEAMRHFTISVPHYIYRVEREDWQD
jgi:RimJ/RimL family protein N-acetyltransferase